MLRPRTTLTRRVVVALDASPSHIPVLLGGGVSLLPPPSKLSELKLVNHQVYEKTGTVTLEYAVS